MNYKNIYENLISRAKDRICDSFTETHHIIPRCIGGTNDKTNLVELTPEEHFLAHQLLAKIYPDNPKIILAARYMCIDSNGRRVNNKLFGWIKRRFAESMCTINTGRKHSDETKMNMSNSRKGRIGPMLGKVHSQETKDKMREAHLGKSKPPRSEAHKKNHADSIRGKARSEETKNKIKESTIGKTFEERYGPEDAARRKEILRLSWEKRRLNKTCPIIPQP